LIDLFLMERLLGRPGNAQPSDTRQRAKPVKTICTLQSLFVMAAISHPVAFAATLR
jgi:hypothetical protein